MELQPCRKKEPHAPVSSLLKLTRGGFGLVQQDDVPGDVVHQMAKGEEQCQSLPGSLQQGEKDFGMGFWGCDSCKGGFVMACSCSGWEQRKGSHLFKRRGCKSYCVSWSVEWILFN